MYSVRGVQRVILSGVICLVLFLCPMIVHANSIEVCNPLFGDIWFSHDARTIQWEADYHLEKVCIELYKGNEYLHTIVSKCDNTGAYYWMVPEGFRTGGDYRIRIVDAIDKMNYCLSRYFWIAGGIISEKSSDYEPTQTSRQWDIYTVDNTADVGYFSSINVDNQNRPHISYYDTSTDDLKYAYWDGSTWQIEVIDQSGDVGRWTSIAVDTNTNNVHISYCHEGNRDLKYAKWDGSTWMTETVDASGNRGEYTCIDLDSYGNPHISYIYGGSGDLMYAFKTGAMWGTICVDDEDDTGRYTGIDLDNNDYPHFSYHDYTWQLFNWRHWCKHAYYDGSWHEQWVDQRNYTGYYSSIAVDKQNFPPQHKHISYQGIAHCEYAHWTGSSWQRTALDQPVGDLYIAGTSITLDADGNPHIVYYRASSTSQGRLAYAYWNNTSWVIDIVDSVGSVGGYPSIVLDDANYIHISYIDWTNTALKYATKEFIVTIEEEEYISRQDDFVLRIKPNPSHVDRTLIEYVIPVQSNVNIMIYNSLGQNIETLVTRRESAGTYTVVWDGSDNFGKKVPVGVYFITFETEEYKQTEKLLLMR